MCGITGIYNFDKKPVSESNLKKMTDAIAHRGPDDEGQYVDGEFGLGHRRLSIIDLSPLGRQPMSSKDSRFVLTYNGEIYNFKELRAELIDLGHKFTSQTDSEVVLASYIEWGERCLNRFNGMFAFAIYDNVEKQFFLSRDRYGIKPLYFAVQGSTFYFGSEVKAILAHPEFKRKLNKRGLVEYLTFQNFFTSNTLIEDIQILPAGTFLKINKQTNIISERYWDYNFHNSTEVSSKEEYSEELDRLFRQAVKRQLVGDVEVGSYLSGGMDSGSITAIASQELPYMKTFTCGFDLNSASGVEISFDERAVAEYMSFLFKTEHYEVVLKAGDMERILPKLTYHLDEPRVGQSYPNYYAAQLASKFVTVCLSGTGGDELFGGYPWRYYRAAVNSNFNHYIEKYYKFWQRLINNSDMKKVLKPIWSDVDYVSTKDIFSNVFNQHKLNLTSPEDYINHSLYFEVKTFMNGLLIVEDKISMAHSLETRVPFLDNDLVEFAQKLPVKYKLGNLDEIIKLNENEPGHKTQKYFTKNKDGKLLLRTVMDNYIPKEITQREKQGFSAPDASWFKGESIEYVKKLLYDNDARIYNYLDKTEILKLVQRHMDGKENKRLLIWSLLNLEHFLRIYLP